MSTDGSHLVVSLRTRLPPTLDWQKPSFWEPGSPCRFFLGDRARLFTVTMGQQKQTGTWWWDRAQQRYWGSGEFLLLSLCVMARDDVTMSSRSTRWRLPPPTSPRPRIPEHFRSRVDYFNLFKFINYWRRFIFYSPYTRHGSCMSLW